MDHSKAFRIIDIPEHDAVTIKFIINDGNFYYVEDITYIAGQYASKFSMPNHDNNIRFATYNEAIEALNSMTLDNTFAHYAKYYTTRGYIQERKEREALGESGILRDLKEQSDNKEAEEKRLQEIEKKKKTAERKHANYERRKKIKEFEEQGLLDRIKK